ncbi:MAG: Crp/Fnr family transcriptional regulator [Saprospiraceae bacterium]
MIKLDALLPSLDTALIEEMESKGIRKTVNEGTILLDSGQPIRNTIIILDGLVKLYREDTDGNEYFMYHLEPGDACALSMVCAMNYRTSAMTAKAVTDTRLLLLPLDLMDSWMQRYPSWNQFIVCTIRTRLEELLETIDQIAFRKMDERLLFYLKKHKESIGSEELQVTHAEIAQELNSSREVITRLLRKLAEQGKISLKRSAIILHDL